MCPKTSSASWAMASSFRSASSMVNTTMDVDGRTSTSKSGLPLARRQLGRLVCSISIGIFMVRVDGMNRDMACRTDRTGQ